MVQKRYLALDSWRGLCALIVALYHVKKLDGNIVGLAFIQHGWMFVDFFFVLSGFVICANYAERLKAQQIGIGRFMLLRFARLYPLHLVMLAAVVIIEALPLIVPPLVGIFDSAPFSRTDESPGYVLANLLLVHAMGFTDRLSWNIPSWSISVEFWTYLIFAVVTVSAREKTLRLIAVAAIIVLPILLGLFSPANLNATVHLGLLRCLYGFAMGAVIWRLHQKFARFSTTSELVVAASVAGFVTMAGEGPFSLVAPYLFGAAVLVFAAESGAVSRALRWTPLQMLGVLSYSIYMVHGLIRTVVYKVAGGISGFEADLLCLIYLVIVVVASFVTYRLIEMPGRETARRWALPELVRLPRRTIP